MTGFIGTLFWALCTVLQVLVALLIRAFVCVLWFVWPFVLMASLMLSAQSAEAGWFSWLWGGSSTRHLERSLDVAQEAARVASEAAEAQAQQAAAQADQNSRVAEAVVQLSAERQDYAAHLRAVSESALWDSQLAAVLDASGPVIVCIFSLTVAGLALRLVTRSEGPLDRNFPGAVDALLEELAAGLPEDPSGRNSHGMHIERASDVSPRLPLIGAGKGSGIGPEDEPGMPF